MSSPDKSILQFDPHLADIASEICVQDQPVTSDACPDPFEAAQGALHSPLDFPAMSAAIVPGDQVAIAVDPNAPQVSRVLAGVLHFLKETDATNVSVVIGDEACGRTVAEIESVAGDTAQVEIHRPSDRESLRFLGPDALGNPMYLNRWLVDADFVLPITSGRRGDLERQHDLSGFFPAFSDSASRLRLLSPQPEAGAEPADPNEPAWALGAQLILCVTSSTTGEVADVVAGTVDSIRKRLQETRYVSTQKSPTSLVVASLDGDHQQQTWENVSRAATAAAREVDSGGTIVLWTRLSDVSSGHLLSIAEQAMAATASSQTLAEDEFPSWDPTLTPVETLRKLTQEYRVLLHSELSPEESEAMGMGKIESGEELSKLTRSFSTCKILRAASFCGSTYNWAEIAIQ
jgi:nickel-dependent lactate racemase